jgi:2-dehydropantoate 2-reductase
MPIDSVDREALRLGVAGAGATGGYLTAALANAGFDVTLLARGSTAKAVIRDGITVRGPGERRLHARPARTVVAGQTVEPVDVTLFCVKAYDTAQAAEDIAALVGERGRILCLQNGIANEEVLASVYGSDRVLSGVLYIGAERAEPTVIDCRTGARIILGSYDGQPNELLGRVQGALSEAGVDCTVEESIRAAKWQKFLFNCGLNPLTALTGQRLGQIRSVPAGRRLFEALVDEALEAAVASGAPVPPDARSTVMATADRMDISSSMAEDRAAGRPMELEAFTGHVLRLAQAHGVPAPHSSVVHALLQVVDARG